MIALFGRESKDQDMKSNWAEGIDELKNCINHEKSPLYLKNVQFARKETDFE